MPEISLITPIRDREHLLPAIAAYATNQSIQDFEWLIHDGSRDRSPTLTALMKKDDRAR